MKNLNRLFFAAFMLLVMMSFCKCNNNGKQIEVDEYRTADGTYWYVINKSNTTWFYSTSVTRLTSATQVGPNDWTSSGTFPRQLTGETVQHLGTEAVSFNDLPQNLQNQLE